MFRLQESVISIKKMRGRKIVPLLPLCDELIPLYLGHKAVERVGWLEFFVSKADILRLMIE